MYSRAEMSRSMTVLENQMAKIFKPAPIILSGAPCTHSEVDGVCPQGCLSLEDRKFISDLFKTKIVTFSYVSDSSSGLKKREGKAKVTCTQGNQKFEFFRKGDYLVESSEHGEKILAKIPRKSP